MEMILEFVGFGFTVAMKFFATLTGAVLAFVLTVVAINVVLDCAKWVSTKLKREK
jgi:ABC-type phosphate/phosphonate transport system permease subunit